MGLSNAVRDMRTIKRLLTRAEAEARSGGEQTPGPEHLLLAATTLPDGTAARALERVGVDPQRLRTAIEEAHACALAAVGIEVELRSGSTAGLRARPPAPSARRPRRSRFSRRLSRCRRR
jgi:ATP-dependent Clp protease ATP-binding subunit ClpA